VKTRFLLDFQLQHFVVSPSSGTETQLNVDEQPQTFPYLTVLKTFPYSNALMAKLLAQTLPIKKRDTTKIQTPNFFAKTF